LIYYYGEMNYKFELAQSVEQKFGSPIKTKTDAQLLGLKIFEELKIHISESTIKRFFNLIPSGRNSLSTLNIFSRYVGFNSCENFKENCNSNILKVIFNKSDEFIISKYCKKNELTILDVNLIANRIILLIKEGNIESSKLYFNSYELKVLITGNINLLFLFSQLLGPIIEDPKLIANPHDLLETQYFKQLVIYNYVDLQNQALERYYLAIINTKPSSLDLTFASTIVSLNYVYKNELDLAKLYFEKIDPYQSKIPPVLAGRIALLNWVFKKDNEKLIKAGKLYIRNINYFSIDILQYFILNNNLNMLSLWFYNFPYLIVEKNNTFYDKEINAILLIARILANRNKELFIELLKNKPKFVNSNTIINKIKDKFLENGND
jgi:hypothetical protein